MHIDKANSLEGDSITEDLVSHFIFACDGAHRSHCLCFLVVYPYNLLVSLNYTCCSQQNCIYILTS